jgi:hypothetical protein
MARQFLLEDSMPEFDNCIMEFEGKSCFRPRTHPLASTVCCKKCKHPTVSLPSYPTDWFDCETCGHSWAPTTNQIAKMNRGVIDTRPLQDLYGNVININ